MQGNHKMAGPDFLTSLVLMGFGAAVMIGAARMKVFRMLIVSPGLFPMILGGVFFLFGVVMFYISIKRGGLGQARQIFSAEYLSAAFRSPRFFRGGVIFLLILGYVVLFGNPTLAAFNTYFTVGNEIIPVNIGFLLTTGGYLFLTFVFLKALPVSTSLIVSLVAAILVFYAFNKGFGIPIP